MTLNFEAEAEQAINAALDKALNESAQKRVETAVFSWLAFTARKKPVDDLADRLERFRKRIEVLARNVSLSCVAGEIVVRATGDGEITLRMLKRGTDWFDPADDLDGIIAGAILTE